MDPRDHFSDVELTGIAVIVTVVAVLAWFTTDTTGVGRIVTVALATLFCAAAAAVSLWVTEGNF
ncbi:hypothetical protein GCM10028857_17030 [Salinarchaeum chitinilyticum]